jgi:hypothetical protein
MGTKRPNVKESWGFWKEFSDKVFSFNAVRANKLGLK